MEHLVIIFDSDWNNYYSVELYTNTLNQITKILNIYNQNIYAIVDVIAINHHEIKQILRNYNSHIFKTVVDIKGEIQRQINAFDNNSTQSGVQQIQLAFSKALCLFNRVKQQCNNISNRKVVYLNTTQINSQNNSLLQIAYKYSKQQIQLNVVQITENNNQQQQNILQFLTKQTNGQLITLNKKESNLVGSVLHHLVNCTQQFVFSNIDTETQQIKQKNSDYTAKFIQKNNYDDKNQQNNYVLCQVCKKQLKEQLLICQFCFCCYCYDQDCKAQGCKCSVQNDFVEDTKTVIKQE